MSSKWSSPAEGFRVTDYTRRAKVYTEAVGPWKEKIKTMKAAAMIARDCGDDRAYADNMAAVDRMRKQMDEDKDKALDAFERKIAAEKADPEGTRQVGGNCVDNVFQHVDWTNPYNAALLHLKPKTPPRDRRKQTVKGKGKGPANSNKRGSRKPEAQTVQDDDHDQYSGDDEDDGDAYQASHSSPAKRALTPSATSFPPKKRHGVNHPSSSTHSSSSMRPPTTSPGRQYVYGGLPAASYTLHPTIHQIPQYGNPSSRSTPYSMSRAPRHPAIDALQNSEPRVGRGSSSSASSTLRSPIWDADTRIDRPASSSKKRPIRSISKQARRKAELPREWPYKDGGIPGEGGSSSDEGLMLAPQVVGRRVFEGGAKRTNSLAAPAATAPPGPWVPYKEQTYEEVMKAFGKISRRRAKLFTREVKAMWDKAQADGDEEGMRAAIEMVETSRDFKPALVLSDSSGSEEPRAKLPPRKKRSKTPRTSVPVPLSADRGEFDIRRGAAIPGTGQSKDRTEAWVDEVQVPGSHSQAASPNPRTLPGNEDSTPFDQAFRHGSQASGPRMRQSPSVVVISSTENTPNIQPSLSMKDRLSFANVDLPKNKATAKPQAAKGKDSSQNQVDPERARQQRIADQIVGAELKYIFKDMHKDLFGEEDDITADDVERQTEHNAELRRQETQRREEAKLQAEVDHENARIAEAKKQQQIADARKQERLLKDREEISKKQKREIERKRMLAEDEQLKDVKRKQAMERIEAQRAKDKAKAEAREKESEKAKTIEMDNLKLEIMRKDLALKKFQAATLSAGKASSAGASKTPVSKTGSGAEENLLFVSGTHKDVDTGLFANRGGFRSMVAEERERVLQEQRSLEEQKRSDACKARLDVYRKSAASEPKRARQPKNPRTASKTISGAMSEEPEQNTLANFVTAIIADKSTDDRPTQPTKRKTAPPASAPAAPLSPAPKVYKSVVRILTKEELAEKKNNEKKALEDARNLPRAPKVYTSVVRLLTKQELAEKRNAKSNGKSNEESNEKRALEEAEKLKVLQERRAKELPLIAERHRLKLIKDAKEGNYTLSDTELQVRVDNHMKTNEKNYQKKQAKKYGTSFVLSQSQAEQENPSFPASSSERVPTQTDGTENLATVQRRRYTPKTVQDLANNLTQSDIERLDRSYDSDSETESEEDPDDEADLNAMMATKKTAGNGEGEGQARGGASQPEGDAQDEEELPADNDPQDRASKPSKDFYDSDTSDPNSQKSIKETDKIRIYTVRKAETKDNEQLPEVEKELHDRDEANEMAEEFVTKYRKAKNFQERSFSRSDDDGLYRSEVVFDEQNSLIVEVTSEFADPAPYGIDPFELKYLWPEEVYIIKQELKEIIKDEATGHTNTKSFMKDIGNAAYAGRDYANSHACEHLVKFLEPPKAFKHKYEKEWSEWAKAIRAELAECKAKSRMFDVEMALDGRLDDDGDPEPNLEWCKWNEIQVMVQVRKIKGPRN